MDNSTLEAWWLYGANIISIINQKKIKQQAACNRENGNSVSIYGRKSKDKSELDPGEFDPGKFDFDE